MASSKIVEVVPRSAAAWAATTFVIPRGVIALESDTFRMKTGTGRHTFAQLDYRIDAVLTQPEKQYLVKANTSGGVVLLETDGKIPVSAQHPFSFLSPDGTVSISNTANPLIKNIDIADLAGPVGTFGKARYTAAVTRDAKGRVTNLVEVLITPEYDDVQNKPANLVSLAGVTGAADTIPIFTGIGAMASTALTPFSRTVLAGTNKGGWHTLLDLVPGTHVQVQNLNLSAIAGLTLSADQLIYATGPNAVATTSLPAFSRSVLGCIDQPTWRTALGVAIGVDVQAYDATLQALAGTSIAADKLIYATGVDQFTTTDFKAYGRTLAGMTTNADLKTDLGLGSAAYQNTTVFQAADAGLASIAGLSTTADQFLYTTASDTWAVGTMTSFVRALMDDPDQESARATLGVTIGTHVQAYDAGLASIAGLTGAGVMVATGTDTYTLRSIGVANPTDILERQGADGRYLMLTNGGTVSVSGVINYTGNLQIAGVNVATTAYVDAIRDGNIDKAHAATSTSGNITLSGIQDIDGVTGAVDLVVLVKDQTNKAENGLYLMKSGAWVRVTNMDTWAEVPGARTLVLGGTNATRTYRVYATMGGTLGTTDIVWTQESGSGTYTASAGIVVAGNDFQLTGQALALHNLSGTGVTVRTGTNTFASRAFIQPTTGFTISNPTTGDITFTLTNDLGALEALNGTGIAVRTAADTWAQRSFVSGSTNSLTVTNPMGILGDITITLAQNIHTAASPQFAGSTLTNLLNFNAGMTINNGIRWQGGSKDMRLVMKDASRVVMTDESDGQELFSFYEDGRFTSHVGAISTVGQLISTVATGTAPLAVNSTTQVTNLNAQLHGGLTTSQFLRSDQSATLSNGTLTVVAAASSNTALFLEAGNGYGGSVRYRVGGVLAWYAGMDQTTKTGSGNVGANWRLERYDDAGVVIDQVIDISRATGVVRFSQNPTVAGSALWHAGNFTPGNYAALASANTFTATQRVQPTSGRQLVVGPQGYLDLSSEVGGWGMIGSGIHFDSGYKMSHTWSLGYAALMMRNNVLYFIGGSGNTTAGDTVTPTFNTVWHSGNFTPNNYLQTSGGTITSASPWLGFTESDQTGGAGKWAFVLDGNTFGLRRNTAVAGDWSSYTVPISINGGDNVTLSGTLQAVGLYSIGIALGANAGDTTLYSQFQAASGGNTNFLRTQLVRHTAGSNWNGTSVELRRRVDSTDQAFVRFGHAAASSGLSMGTGTTESFKLDDNANLSFGTTTNRSFSLTAANTAATARYDDNSLSTPFTISNCNVSSAGLGVGIMAVMGTGGAVGGDAGFVRWQTTDNWSASGNRSARAELGYSLAGVLTTGLTVDQNGIQGTRFNSSVATGTAPLVVQSTTQVNNLNAQYHGGYAVDQGTGGNTVAVRDASGGLWAARNYVVSTSPTLTMNKSDGATNAKFWDFYAGTANRWSLRAVNDAYDNAIDAIAVNRSGFSVTNVEINAPLTTQTVTSTGVEINTATGSGGLSINAYTTGEGGELKFYSADGTQASPTVVANGKILSDISTFAHNGSGQQSAAYIRTVAGTVAGGNVPATMHFLLRSGGALNTAMSLTGTGISTGYQFTSTVATGTAPLSVASTTAVANLNADMVDGYQANVSTSTLTVAVRDSNGDLASRAAVAYAGQTFNIDSFAQTGGYWAGIYGTSGTGSSGTAPANYTAIVQLYSHGGGQGLQLAASYANGQDYYIRRRSDSAGAPNGANAWQPWNKMVTNADLGIANGVATLGADGKLTAAQAPSASISKAYLAFMGTAFG